MFIGFFRITYYHRHKTVVKDWFGNGFPTSLGGKVELIQETEFSSSSIEMDLNGMKGEAGRFGIFEVQYNKFKTLHATLYPYEIKKKISNKCFTGSSEE